MAEVAGIEGADKEADGGIEIEVRREAALFDSGG